MSTHERTQFVEPAERLGRPATSTVDDGASADEAAPAWATGSDRPATSGAALVQQLLASTVLLAEEWHRLARPARQEVLAQDDAPAALRLLVGHGLLTEYQAGRLEAGTTFGLVLGNYRVLDRLGAGGMGIVFRAEHRRLRRTVAVKVLSVVPGQDPQPLQRFYAEMQAVAQLDHPNIVAATDAGEVASTDPDRPVLHYLVMEYVPGRDLEAHVQRHGPLAPTLACDLAHQLAGALADAHRQGLVHRDVKPSNVVLTPEGQARLLDFGLARRWESRLTLPGTVLGAVAYMAPEQALDAGAVDGRADLYGLGGVLFWCLTGKPPFAPRDSLAQEVACRLSQQPPSACAARPELPAELDAVLARLMALHPGDRYATAEQAAAALEPFVGAPVSDRPGTVGLSGPLDGPTASAGGERIGRVHRVLIVEDDPVTRRLCRATLESEGLCCEEAADGEVALARAHAGSFDLVLSDVAMPGLGGPELCARLRANPPCPHLKVVLISGTASPDEMARVMLAGADDFLSKPLSMIQLRARVKTALRLKDAQDRAEQLNRRLLTANQEMEQMLALRDGDLVRGREAMALAMARLVERRDGETDGHLLRLQRFACRLAEEARACPSLADQIDEPFVEMLRCCAPLHDIGKAGLPDHLLLKPARLSPDERIQMQAHTVLGAEALADVARRYGLAPAFAQMACDVARHHHERYDGQGYPDRLVGEDIPLAARLVAVADVYDGLRGRRVYKPALAHAATVQVMAEASAGQFDPALVAAFLRCADDFERICREVPD